MRFKIDENLPVEAAQLLNAAGHEAATIHDQQMPVDCGRTRCSDSRGRFSQWSMTREAVRRR